MSFETDQINHVIDDFITSVIKNGDSKLLLQVKGPNSKTKWLNISQPELIKISSIVGNRNSNRDINIIYIDDNGMQGQYTTQVAGDDNFIKEYFMDQEINIGYGGNDKFVRVVGIDFAPRKTFIKQ